MKTFNIIQVEPVPLRNVPLNELNFFKPKSKGLAQLTARLAICLAPGSVFRASNFGFRVLGSEYNGQDICRGLKLWISGLGCGVQNILGGG